MNRCLLACLLLAPPLGAIGYDQALAELFEAGLPGEGVPAPDDDEAFERLLASDLFTHEAVGPFDLYVLRQDGLKSTSSARKLLKQAARGLEPLVPVLERHFDREQGLVSGRRFPVLIAETERDDGETGWDRLVALLHWRESAPGGWVGDVGALWSPESLDSLFVRSWDLIAFNLGHPEARTHGDGFLNHAFGYHLILHVVNRVLRLGAWGNVPPWMADGVVDEIDIQAYGEAWYGSIAATSTETTGGTTQWRLEGWSGFLPQGAAPPEPKLYVVETKGTTTTTESADDWIARSASPSRHWSDLAADRTSDHPASFEAMARHESFEHRDRAYSRALVHLLLDVAPPEDAPDLLEALDREVEPLVHGMQGTDPLPAVVSRALGGVPEIERVEALPMRAVLEEIGREDLIEEYVRLGAEEALEIPDHRDQSAWLYHQVEIGPEARQALFNLFLEAEYYQQNHEWKLLGRALDRALDAAFEASKSYPRRDRAREEVGAAFWETVRAGG